MSSLFVAGTDTGIGKTIVTAALLAASRRAGVNATCYKPVQTGTSSGGRDLAYCLRAAGWNPPARLRRAMCPERFTFAASPHLAARRARRRLSARRLAAGFNRLAASFDAVLVEGAGGLLVPLNGRETMLDLARLVRAPLLLVARAGLGTLNHTLLSCEAARARGLRIAAIVLNLHPLRKPRAIELDNARTLSRFTGLPVAFFPSLGPAPARAAFARAGARLLQDAFPAS